MLKLLIELVVLVVAFVAGVIVGRNNPKKVTAAVNAGQKVISEVESAAKKL